MSSLAYLTEARDPHGRWIHGLAGLEKEIKSLVSSGKITHAQGKLIGNAISRHTEKGRGIPHTDTHNHAATLEYLARTLRHDSLSARQQKSVALSKQLSRTARAVETAHSALTGKERKVMPAISSHQLTPNEKHGEVTKTGKVLDLKPKLKQKASAPKVVSKGPRVKSRAKQPQVKVKAEAPKVVRKSQSFKVSAANVKKGDEITIHRARIQTGTQQLGLSSYSQPVYKRVADIRTVTDVQKLDNGKIGISVSQASHPEILAGNAIAKGAYGGYYHKKVEGSAHTVEAHPSEIYSVKRLSNVQKVSRKKSELAALPGLQEYHAALASELAKGASVEQLKQYDPARRPLPKGHENGHAQQLLYDMALGKASGKIPERGRVVTNTEYMQRLTANGEIEKIGTAAHESVPYVFTGHGQYNQGMWEPGKRIDIPGATPRAKVEKIIMEHGGTSASVKMVVDKHSNDASALAQKQIKQRIEELRRQEGTSPHEYAIPRWNELHLQAQNWNDINKLIHTQHKMEAPAELNAGEIRSVIRQSFDSASIVPNKTMAGADGDIAQKKTYGEMHSLIDKYSSFTADQKQAMHVALHAYEKTHPQGVTHVNAPRDYVPTFHTAGMVEDGVLYHRATSGNVDPEKLKKALTQAGVSDWSATQISGAAARANNVAAAHQWIQSALAYPHQLNEKQLAANVLNKVDRALQKQNVSVTTARVSKNSNQPIRKILEGAGAANVPNSKAPEGTGTWTTLKPGEMLMLQEGGKPLSESEKVAKIKTSDLSPASIGSNAGDFGNKTQAAIDQMQVANQRWSGATSVAQLDQAQKQYAKAVGDIVAIYKAQIAEREKQGLSARFTKRNLRRFNETYATRSATARKAIDSANAYRTGSGIKRIEYVPWNQTDAPRNQRGRLTLEGYTPQEAHAKLQQLGIVGGLESHIPATSIFRSERRTGVVTPLLSPYVRGEVQPPRSENLLSHGITDRKRSPVEALRAIAASGGLMSISERFKRGIHTGTTSQVGDIGSGVDHVVFLSLDSGGACGAHSPVKILLKPDVLMRRDVVLANHDFGGGKDRYNHYKKYRDNLEAQAGAAVGKTDIWTPLAPQARQAHLDGANPRPGSSEYNVAGQLPVEDWSAVAVSKEQVSPVRDYFQSLKDSGVITSMPTIITKEEWGVAVKA